MDSARLLADADAARATAESILDRLDLLARWSAVGRVEVVGSVALDVVVRPDIDLEIYVDTLEPRAGFDAIVAIADIAGVRRIRYLDARDLPMNGLYWKVEYEDGGQNWTIDNWMFAGTQPGNSAGATAAIQAAIARDAGARATILRIKRSAVERGERAHGRWVYEAVLDHGIDDYSGYLEWLGDRDVWARSAWTPALTQAISLQG